MSNIIYVMKEICNCWENDCCLRLRPNNITFN